MPDTHSKLEVSLWHVGPLIRRVEGSFIYQKELKDLSHMIEKFLLNHVVLRHICVYCSTLSFKHSIFFSMICKWIGWPSKT